jgi:hypothetical protein
MRMFTASIAWDPCGRQGGDDPCGLLLEAYDHQQPPAGTNGLPVTALTSRYRVRLDVIRLGDGGENRL